jgi:crotonobetaine/carnitine-CoA ligase
MTIGDTWVPNPEDPRTIGEWIRHKAARNGDKVALEIVDRPKTYRGIDVDSDRVAVGLTSLGLKQGDRAALMMKNSLENVDVWFAMCKLNVLEVPINTANRGHLLHYLVMQSGSRAVVCDEEFAERIAEVAVDLPDLEHVVINDEGRGLGVPSFPKHVTVHRLSDLYLDGTPPRPSLTFASPSVILYTSGTTGPSKGVVLSHEANLNLARHLRWLVGYESHDVLYTAFPLFHINAKYTSVMCAMESDAKLVMDQRFTASGFWDICRRKGITAFNYQGALLMMLWKQPEKPDDLDNPVRNAFGAPCPVDIWEPFEKRFGLHLTEVYGMTEIAIATQNTKTDRKIGSCGKVCSYYDLQIVDDEDNPVPAGVAGEIVVRSKKPSIMIDEYYKMPEATVNAFRNLWFHTGDRGKLDDEGYLYFVDRMKDCVRRRGENVSSFEVEAVINTHESVLESAVYGAPSELGEEEVMAAVVLKPGFSLTEVELLDHCVTRMAHFAVPRFIRWVPELPKTPSQRIQKYKLRDEGVTADTWDRDKAGYIVKR